MPRWRNVTPPRPNGSEPRRVLRAAQADLRLAHTQLDGAEVALAAAASELEVIEADLASTTLDRDHARADRDVAVVERDLAQAAVVVAEAEVERQLAIAASVRLALESGRLLSFDVDLSALLALRSASVTSMYDTGHDGRPLVTEEAEVALSAVASQPWRATLAGHTGPLSSAAFTPDGTRIVTASSDQTFKVWDLDGDVEMSFDHPGEVRSAAVSPAGQHLLTVGVDGTARLWDRGGSVLATMAGHGVGESTAAFSPDGTQIVTAGRDGTVKIWAFAPDGSPRLQTILLHGRGGTSRGRRSSAAMAPASCRRTAPSPRCGRSRSLRPTDHSPCSGSRPRASNPLSGPSRRRSIPPVSAS